MPSFTRLLTTAALCGGLLVMGSPALADATDATAPTTTSSTTATDAGIQGAGLASRAPKAGCAKHARTTVAGRHCAKRPGGR